MNTQMTATEKQDLFCGLRIIGIAALTSVAAAILYAGPQAWNNYTNPADSLMTSASKVVSLASGGSDYLF